MKVTNTSAVILAGGKSSRMGRDKSSLKIGETTFCQKLLDEFGKHFKSVYLSVAANSPLTGSNIIKDERVDLGPLAGLEAAIKGTDGENVFICATDMPYADPSLALQLTEMLGKHDACLIRGANGRVETAFCVFSKRILPAVQLELETGKRSFMGLLDRIDARIVDLSELGTVSDLAFANINTPEEYEKVM